MVVRPILPDEFAASHLGRAARSRGYGFEHNAVSLRSILPEVSDARHREAIERAAACAGIDAHSLLVDHTLLPVHYAFSDDHVSHSDRPESQKFEALAAHRSPYLKFCRECQKEDIVFRWISYWRRSHQLPGVNFCAKHACPLVVARSSPTYYTSPGELGIVIQRFADADAVRDLENRIHDLWSGLLAHGRPISALATRYFVRNSVGIRTPRDEEEFVKEAVRALPPKWLAREFGGASSVSSALQARVMKVKDSVPTILLLALLELDVDTVLNALIGSALFSARDGSGRTDLPVAEGSGCAGNDS